jgi:hypothetical protein
LAYLKEQLARREGVRPPVLGRMLAVLPRCLPGLRRAVETAASTEMLLLGTTLLLDVHGMLHKAGASAGASAGAGATAGASGHETAAEQLGGDLGAVLSALRELKARLPREARRANQLDRLFSVALVPLLPAFAAAVPAVLVVGGGGAAAAAGGGGGGGGGIVMLCLRWLAVADDQLRWVTPSAVEARSMLLQSLEALLRKLRYDVAVQRRESVSELSDGGALAPAAAAAAAAAARKKVVWGQCARCMCLLLAREGVETPVLMRVLGVLEVVREGSADAAVLKCQ